MLGLIFFFTAIIFVLTQPLHKSSHLLQKDSLALGLVCLVSPKNDGIIGKHIVLVEELHNLAEELGEFGILIAGDLDVLKEDKFGLGRSSEGFQDIRPALYYVCQHEKMMKTKDEENKHTLIARKACTST